MGWVRKEEYQRLGALLAQACEKAGVTQTEVAKQLGKPQSFVSSYEIGQRRIDLLEFLRVAEALKTDPKRLFASIGERLTRAKR